MGMINRIASVTVGAALAIAVPFIVEHEEMVYETYIDIAGIPTACAGITGKDVTIGKRYTHAECEALTAKHVMVASDAVDRIIKRDLPVSTRAAIISFTFNVGQGALAKSTLAKKANAGDFKGACLALKDWVYITKIKNGKKVKVKVKGLVNRRNAEYDLCIRDLK